MVSDGMVVWYGMICKESEIETVAVSNVLQLLLRKTT